MNPQEMGGIPVLASWGTPIPGHFGADPTWGTIRCRPMGTSAHGNGLGPETWVTQNSPTWEFWGILKASEKSKQRHISK